LVSRSARSAPSTTFAKYQRRTQGVSNPMVRVRPLASDAAAGEPT